MLANLRARRILITVLVTTSLALGLVLILIPSPDLSIEQQLHRQIAHLSLRIEQAEKINVERKDDLQRLFQQFSLLTHSLMKSTGKGGTAAALLEDNKNFGFEAAAMIQGANWTYDLSLPSITNALPYLVHSPRSLLPAFKLSKDRSKVSMVLGIPTVKRDHQSYLQTTLRSIFNNIQPEEEKDTLVIVFVAETDMNFVKSVAQTIKEAFTPQLESGILDVISPPVEYYPDWSSLRQTLGDPPERVQW